MNKYVKDFLIATRVCSVVLLTLFIARSAQAQTTDGAPNDKRSGTTSTVAGAPRFRFSLPLTGVAAAKGARANVGSSPSTINFAPMAAGPNLQVLGSGTTGRLTKWTGFTSSNSVIGDSTIFEDKNGLVGVGTDTPTSKLTVAGMIQTTLGGLKFPDGSLQTTAAVTGLQSVIHNATLQGQGTQGSPLGVAIPLSLTGAGAEILSVQNNSVGGGGIVITAGDGNSSDGGGDGIVTSGGDASASEAGGGGVRASGGTADRGTGGTGVRGFGGDSASGFGGLGVEARAGSSLDGEGGVALSAIGGSGRRGGNGLFSVGGTGFGAGNSGGIGIVANAGVGLDGATPGLAGRFSGSVQITGSLSKGGGSFKIDHPLDPENKYLYHSFVESPDMMNIYNGNVVTDENGEAAITLPAYFEALNRDFRYQLTVIGTFAQAIVSDEVKGNRFIIRTSAPSVKVSWQVTGIRRDAWADKNRIPVEVEKDELERGHYLHPEAFSKPEEKGVEWARNPEMKKLQ